MSETTPVAARAISFKVDVDTHDGMKNGVPRLLDLFAKHRVTATFFLSFGPDNAGKAILQIFTKRGFLKKMLRTNAPGLYGWRTILSGTLLPARPIAAAFPDLVHRIREAGHEVAVHAWDHRFWQDHLAQMSEAQITEQFIQSFRAFETILGVKPLAVAAPGWQLTAKSLKVQDRLELTYASDLRNGSPVFPELDGYTATTLQIPTTTRCLEELLAAGLRDEASWEREFLADLRLEPHPVFPLHTEVEGGPFADCFDRFLPKLLAQFPRTVTLHDYATTILAGQNNRPAVRPVKLIEIPGRGGLVPSCG